MKADLSRSTYSPTKHFHDVRLQQGRVQLDADWNEQIDIAAHRVEAETIDVVGPCGAPMDDAAFALAAQVSALPAVQQPAATALGALASGDFFLSAGRFYAQGILCENDQPVKFSAQSDFPGATPIGGSGLYLAYLEVWPRLLTFLDEPLIREVALNGPDTADRVKTIWQVKLVNVGVTGATADCSADYPAYDTATAAPTGELSARAEPSATDDKPCIIEPGAGYRSLENQLYRVEVHQAGSDGTATFKWSRDNGAVVARWQTTTTANLIQLLRPPPDDKLGFAVGQWVEITDDIHELNGQPGMLVQITRVDPQFLTLGNLPQPLTNFTLNPKVRRWDSANAADTAGDIVITAGGWIDLENGVQVQFAAGTFRTGDYWFIPARTATANVEWPTDSSGNPMPSLPHGIPHVYCRLGFVDFNGTTITSTDCRQLFPPLTELTSLFYLSGDGQEAPPGQPLPKPLQVGVATGKWPVPGARVRFEHAASNGSLSAGTTLEASDFLIVTTDINGVAECQWTLDATTPSQQVTATLLDSADQRVHLPIRFNASFADQREPGMHVVGVLIEPPTPGDLLNLEVLENDTLITIAELVRGLRVICDQNVLPATVEGKPTCFVMVGVPLPIQVGETRLASVGFQPLVLADKKTVTGMSISWTPPTLPPTFTSNLDIALTTFIRNSINFGLGDQIPGRLILKGSVIWSSGDKGQPQRYLDGAAFGQLRPDNSTDLIAPSGDGRRGGDFETWFRIVTARPQGPQSYVINFVVGFNLIANQLNHIDSATGAVNNSLDALLPGVPVGTRLLKFDNTSQAFEASVFDDLSGSWSPTLTLNPGEGAYLVAPSAFSMTFTGVTHSIAQPAIRTGPMLLSRQIPRSGIFENIVGANPRPGTVVLRLIPGTESPLTLPGPNPTGFDKFEYNGQTWQPYPPKASVGESIWILMAS